MYNGGKGGIAATPKSKPDYYALIMPQQGTHKTSTMLQTGATAMKPAIPIPSHNRSSGSTTKPQVSLAGQQASEDKHHFPTQDSTMPNQTSKAGSGLGTKSRGQDSTQTEGRPGDYMGNTTSSLRREPPSRITPDFFSEPKTTGTASLPRDPVAKSQATLPPRDNGSRQSDKSTLVTAGSTALTSTTQTTSLPRAREKVGLRNLGNTCFMNSILQCVAHTPGFIDTLLTVPRTDINRRSKLQGQLAEQFAELMKEMRTSRTAVSPEQVKHMVGRFAPQFSGYMQQDAHEFLRFLLDGLHEDLNRVQSKQPYRELEGGGSDYSRVASEWFQYHKNRDDSIVTDYFRGQLLTIITCSRCTSKSIACDTFLDLSVPVPRTSSVKLQDCFNEFISETQVDEYKCEKCRKVVPSRMEMTIWKFPPILVIQLKRFSSSSWRRSKIDTDVTFPVKGFSLSQYAPHSTDPSTRNAVYRLFGVSHHMGDMGFGHYVA